VAISGCVALVMIFVGSQKRGFRMNGILLVVLRLGIFCKCARLGNRQRLNHIIGEVQTGALFSAEGTFRGDNRTVRWIFLGNPNNEIVFPNAPIGSPVSFEEEPVPAGMSVCLTRHLSTFSQIDTMTAIRS
jgi:hypothetical protein